MNPISVRLTKTNQQFVAQYLETGDDNQTNLINKALDIFRKYNLQKELMEFAEENEQEDQKMAEEGIDDYLILLNES